jgi:hypothetical protein
MIRLLLLAAAGLVGYRLAKEYVGNVPSDFRMPGEPPRQARRSERARQSR